MNRLELTKAVSKKSNYSIDSVEKILDAYFEVITETCYKGLPIKIAGFGTIKPIIRNERKCAHPRTREIMVVPKFIDVKFMPSDGFKKILNAKRS